MDVISIGETMALFTPNEDGPLRYARNYQVRIAGAETNTLIGLSKAREKSRLDYTAWKRRVRGDDSFFCQRRRSRCEPGEGSMTRRRPVCFLKKGKARPKSMSSITGRFQRRVF